MCVMAMHLHFRSHVVYDSVITMSANSPMRIACLPSVSRISQHLTEPSAVSNTGVRRRRKERVEMASGGSALDSAFVAASPVTRLEPHRSADANREGACIPDTGVERTIV